MKLIANIAAGILIFFGVLFIWGAGDGGGVTWIISGLISSGIGLAIVWFANRKGKEALGNQKVTYDIELSGDVDLKGFACTRCGGPLAPENISIVAGAPTVQCPYCGSTYQISERPKW